MSITEWQWADSQPVGSPAERVVLLRLADNCGDRGDEPQPGEFGMGLDYFNHDGMSATGLIEAIRGLEQRGLLGDVAVSEVGVSGYVATPRHRAWLDSETRCGLTVVGGARHAQIHTLAERDGWWCYLCHEPLVDVCQHVPELPRELHAWLPQREHVIPRALGGNSRPGNLRLACWPCNARKGAQ